ncbi:Flagellar biosynthesis protein FliR [hydrothermal vent metagenome]|uniref:Flagellar biosynthesis protein FliR n=1 Tax=hydrothermal vent metagenome TaxID=652676 RepID=A0A3B0WNE0_9ZZZZ
MNFTGAELTTWLATLLWPFMRIGAMFAAAPIFSARSVPVRIRIILAFLIAWLLVPVLPAPPAVDLISGEALIISVHQVLIGVAMGFIIQMVFAAFVIAGQSIAMAMGLGFASIIDPQNGLQVPVVSQAFLIMVTLVFLALNGHLVLIDMLAKSFENIPVGMMVPSRDGLWQLVNWGSDMFTGGMLVALPAVAALLLVNLAFGVTTRAAPQLNIFAVGFPVMIMVGLSFIILTLPTITSHLSRLMMQATELIQNFLATA